METAAETKPKFVYFDVYGRRQPIRMGLWKAGVEYEYIRVTG